MKITLVVLSALLVLNGAHAQFGRGERLDFHILYCCSSSRAITGLQMQVTSAYESALSAQTAHHQQIYVSAQAVLIWVMPSSMRHAPFLYNMSKTAMSTTMTSPTQPCSSTSDRPLHPLHSESLHLIYVPVLRPMEAHDASYLLIYSCISSSCSAQGYSRRLTLLPLRCRCCSDATAFVNKVGRLTCAEHLLTCSYWHSVLLSLPTS